ncbi:MAG: radical SAM protein, partial [Elusimicrobiaceae bacterium]|nr:radical SAM protein [Elusimicrobiaceae bacterium]
FKHNLYINLTNQCPNLCRFCIKNKWDMKFHDHNLNLAGKEPTAKQVLTAIADDISKNRFFKELVFCGYGESTLRLQEMVEICTDLKQQMAEGKIHNFKIRLNTIGLGSLVAGRDITKDLKGLIDEINISLNTADPKQWVEIVRPQKKYEELGFEAVLDFIKKSTQTFQSTIVSGVDLEEIDKDELKKLAESLGAKFYLREFLD